MIKICVADQQPIIHQGIKSYFKDNSDFQVSAYAKTLDDLYEILDNKPIQLVIFDIELDGIKSIRDIKVLIRNNPNVFFLVFTNVLKKLYSRNVLRMGVHAYLEKTSPLKEFSEIIRKVVFENFIESQQNQKTKNRAKPKKTENPETLHKRLSLREIEVLKYLNAGLKNKEIAETLGLDEKTISTYKLRLLKKLEVTNLIDLINKAKTLQLV